MRRRLAVFGVAAGFSILAARAEDYFQLDLSTYPRSIGSGAFLVVINLLLFWAVVGWYFAFIDRPAGDFRANIRRVSEAFALFVAWTVLVTLTPLIFAVIGLTASDWTIRLLQATAWPAVIAIAVVMLVRTPSGLQLARSVFARVNKVSVAGVDVELTETAATNVHYSFETSFGEYRKRLDSEFDRQVRIWQVDDKLALVADKAIKETFGARQPDGFRCTIHVPDVLFAQTLYELLDYYPVGGGRGRTFSMRYGMIGRTWRYRDREDWQLEEDVFGGGTKDPVVLLDKWSMTPTEAKNAAAAGVTALVSIVMKEDPSKPAVGILYFDSHTAKAFGDNQRSAEFAAKALKASNEAGLTRDIAQIGLDMRRIGPRLEISK